MIFCGPSAKALVSLSPMTAVSGHVRSEWTCEQEVQKKHGRWPLLYHLKSYTRAIPSEELKKAPDHCPSYHLTIALLIFELRGCSDWNSTLTLVPWLLLSSAFHTCTCARLFAHSDSLSHTFGHSFKFSLFCNLFLLAFPLKLTFHLDCFEEVSHRHSSVLLFFWTRFILCRSLTQPPGLEFLSRVINLYTLRHDIPV